MNYIYTNTRDNRMGVKHTGYDKGAFDSGYIDGRSSMKKGALEA